jgi:hypothetical protein
LDTQFSLLLSLLNRFRPSTYYSGISGLYRELREHFGSIVLGLSTYEEHLIYWFGIESRLGIVFHRHCLTVSLMLKNNACALSVAILPES